MKKRFLWLLFPLLLSGCAQEEPFDNRTHNYLWESNSVYEETVLLYEHDDGDIYGELMFTPTNISEVKNYLKTATYDEDDYEIVGRYIYKKDSSDMPYLTHDQYVGSNLSGTGISTYTSSQNEYGKVLYTEYPHIVKHMILVTYEHDETWEYHVPYRQGNLLPKTINKLKNKENLTLAIYGDSNATGACSTKYWYDHSGEGQSHVGAASIFPEDYPWQVGFPEGFKLHLEDKYGIDVNLCNYAEGGQVSWWGQQNVETWTRDCNPDLVYICFGNNDATFNVKVEDFTNNIKLMIDRIKAINPNAEIIISLPKTNNPLSDQGVRNSRYSKSIKELIVSYGTGVAFVDMTTLVADMLENKGPYDLYANGINHANDFLARIFIEAFAYTLEIPLEGEEYDIESDTSIEEEIVPEINGTTNEANGYTVKNGVTVSDITDGIQFSDMYKLGDGATKNEMIVLDGLEFDFHAKNMRTASDIYTQVGFFFSNYKPEWSLSSLPSNNFTFSLIDIFGQNRIFIGRGMDHTKTPVVYADESCTTLMSGVSSTNHVVMNRMNINGEYDTSGVHVKFSDIGNNIYSIQITQYYSQQMWENNQNFDATNKCVTYYFNAADLGIIDEYGKTYLNFFGYNNKVGNFDTLVQVENLKDSSTVIAPTIKGSSTITYNQDSDGDLRFEYNKNQDDSSFLGIQIGELSVDISERTVGDGYVTVSSYFLKNRINKGEHEVTLICSNGECSWILIVE